MTTKKDEYTFSLEDFTKMLDSKGVKMRCPMCAHHPHGAIPDIKNNVYLTIPAGTGKYPKHPMGYIYCIGLVCKNCGFISQFSGNFIRDYLNHGKKSENE